MQDYDREEHDEQTSNTNTNPLSKENSYDHQTMEEVAQSDRETAFEQKEAALANEEAVTGETVTSHSKETHDATGVEGEEQTVPLSENPTSGTAYSSVSYPPPHYVPNFTVVNTNASGGQADNQAKEKRRAHSALTILLSALLSLIIAVSAGGFAGYWGAFWAQRRLQGTNGENVPLNGVTIEKNNGSIEIQETLSSETDVYEEVSSVAKAVADSVVEISTSMTQTNPFYGQYVTSGAGSGVIIAQNPTTGIIVTNYHVIEGADRVIVRLTNGKEYSATYRGGDASMDIAVLYISLQNEEKLSCATLGDSSQLVVGQRVVAIGNPLGSLGGTVTDGIISALDRKIKIDDNVMTLLQTNTAINPGNSGGGLFDMAGRLVGIVNAKKFAEGIEGLGFAIPINVIEDAIASITEHGYVQNRPTLGVDVTYMDSTFRAQGILYPAGLYVAKSWGKNTSLAVYDRIVSINDQQINSKIDYNTVLSGLAIGEDISIVIERENRRYTLTVTVQENTQDY